MRSLQHESGSNDNNNHEEESKSSRYGFDFGISGLQNTDVMMNNNNNDKPPPQPATAAVNSIHWEVEEGMSFRIVPEIIL